MPARGGAKGASPTQLAVAEILGFPADHAKALSVSVLGHLCIVSPGNDEGVVSLVERISGTVMDLNKGKILLPALGSSNITLWSPEITVGDINVAYIFHQGLRIRAFRYEGTSYYASPSRLDIMKQDLSRETSWGSGKLKMSASQLFSAAKVPSLDKLFDEEHPSSSTVYDFTIVWPAMSFATRARIGAPYTVLSPRHLLCKNSFIHGVPGTFQEERLPTDHFLLNEGYYGGQRFRAMPLAAETKINADGVEELGYIDFLNYGFVPSSVRGTIMSPAYSNDMEAIELYGSKEEPYPLVVMSPGMFDRYTTTVSAASTGELTRAYDLKMNSTPPMALHMMEPEAYMSGVAPTPSYNAYPATNEAERRQQRLAFFLNSVNPSTRGFAFDELYGRYEEYESRFHVLVDAAKASAISLQGTQTADALFPSLGALMRGVGNYEDPKIRNEIDLLDGLVSFAMNVVDQGGASGATHPERIHAVLRKFILSKDFAKMRGNAPRIADYISDAAAEWAPFSINEKTRMSRPYVPADRSTSRLNQTALPSFSGHHQSGSGSMSDFNEGAKWYTQ